MIPKKILVIRLSSLGDVILTAAVLRSLKAHWPDCSLSVLVKPQYAPVLEGNPHVAEIIPFQGLGQALASIRAGGFTHLLDLHDNLRSRLIRRLAGVPQVAVYRKHALARRLFVAFGLRSPALEKHTVERYLDALSAWGVPPGQAELFLQDLGLASLRPGLAPAAAKPAKVLLIQSAFLGDSLLTLPLARELKALLPGCALSVLTLEKTAEIFRDCPWVDEVLCDHKRAEHGGLLGPWRLARRLKREGFGLAVIPHRSLRSALLAWLAGIPRRIGFTASAGRLLLTETVPFTWLMHDLERNLSLLKPLARGPLRPGETAYLASAGEDEKKIAARLEAAGVRPGQRLIGLHPGAAWPTKRWLSRRYAEICRRFESAGSRAVLIGSEEDSELCALIAADSGALDWSGKTDLLELKALMGRLSLFVTNDSGPMHLAAARGVPTLAVFGPTTRELGFFPYGPRHRVVESDLPCRPCGLHGGRDCPQGHFLCMRLITTEQVWETAQAMLEQANRASGHGL